MTSEETYLKNFNAYRNNHEVNMYYSEITRNYTICRNQPCGNCVLYNLDCKMMSCTISIIDMFKEHYPEEFV